MVYSFDIFDTLVSRDPAEPKDLFRLVQEKAAAKKRISGHLLADLPYLRVASEARALEASSRKEVTIDEIYEAMGNSCAGLTPRLLEELKELELELEAEHSYPIIENVERVHALLDRGEKVILVSDMYLTRETIIRILSKVSPRIAELKLYLSSEIGLTKRDGSLFSHVCNEEGLNAEQITHTGDNLFSDWLMPQQAGLNALHYETSALTEIEYAYCNEANGIYSSIIAGASRKARLSRAVPSSCYELGASFTGPIFYGFVENLIREVKTRGISKIYFLARDGYLLREMAEYIAGEQGLGVECAYLYISRQSVYLAALFHLSESSLGWVFENQPSLNKVAQRLGIEADDIKNASASLKEVNENQVLSAGQLHIARETILGNEAVGIRILNASQYARERLLGYLQEEVNPQDLQQLALVDLGWQGSIQDALFQILSNENESTTITGFYYGCLKFNSKTHRQNQKIPYHIFPSTRPVMAPVLECLTAANHGTTLSYQCTEDGQWKPILKRSETELAGTWDFEAYRQGVSDFTKNAAKTFAQYPSLPINYHGIDNNLMEKLEDGIQLAAETIGALPYDSGLEESAPREMAPPFQVASALCYLISGRERRQSLTQWYRASYLRSGWFARFILSLDPRNYLQSVVSAQFDPHKLKIKYVKLKFALARLRRKQS